MTLRAAIRWLTKGKMNKPVIQYMLLDEQLEYLIRPQEIEVVTLKNDVFAVLEKIEEQSQDSRLEIYFKSVNIHYGKHRQDSAQFHFLISDYLLKRNLKKTNSRTAYFLKKDELRLFKDALSLLDIDCKTRGCAYVAFLWMIALKATRSRVQLVVKQIWKKRLSIQKMNKKQQADFLDFYSLINR